MPESFISLEPFIEKRFYCHERSLIPTDFKGVDIISEGSEIFLSQMFYLDTKGKDTHGSINAIKLSITRELTDEEQTQQRRAAGRLAWVGTGTSATSVCLASMALQGK